MVSLLKLYYCEFIYDNYGCVFSRNFTYILLRLFEFGFAVLESFASWVIFDSLNVYAQIIMAKHSYEEFRAQCLFVTTLVPDFKSLLLSIFDLDYHL